MIFIKNMTLKEYCEEMYVFFLNFEKHWHLIFSAFGFQII